MENNLKTYIHNGITLLYTWNWHNIVNQLHSSLKKESRSFEPPEEGIWLVNQKEAPESQFSSSPGLSKVTSALPPSEVVIHESDAQSLISNTWGSLWVTLLLFADKVCLNCPHPQMHLVLSNLKRESTPRFIYQSLPTPGSGISSLNLSYDSSKVNFSCPITKVDLPIINFQIIVVVVVQSLSRIRLLEIPWIAAHQVPLSSTVSWSLLRFMYI